jgi:hypothetical protein
MTGIPRWLPSVVLVAALAVAATQVSVARTMVLGWIAGELLHPPSDRDQFFFLVAVDFKQPDLCDRIDGRADASTGGGWETGDFHLRRLRSECSSRVSRRDWAPSEVPRSMPAFATQMRALGYTDADLAEWVYNQHHYSTLVDDLYRDLLAADEFRSRLRAAASYAEPRDPARLRSATLLEIVYQMVAVDAPEAVLCSRISPNATVKDAVGAPKSLQSRCHAHIAFTTRDSGLCESLPADRSFPYVDSGYDSREDCQRIVAIYRQRDAKEIRPYAPTRLSRAADLRHVLHDIGYPVEKLPHVPAPTDDDYWEFVSDLSFRGDPNARAEFLRRVAALDAR